MGVSLNQSLSLGVSQPEVWKWDPEPEPSSAVNSTIVLLGVLTFGLQLCLAVFFLWKCWSYDKRIQETIKDPDAIGELYKVPPNICLFKDIEKPRNQQHYDVEAAQSASLKSPTMSGASSYCDNEEYRPNMNYLSTPFIAWDIVQC